MARGIGGSISKVASSLGKAGTYAGKLGGIGQKIKQHVMEKLAARKGPKRTGKGLQPDKIDVGRARRRRTFEKKIETPAKKLPTRTERVANRRERRRGILPGRKRDEE